MIPTSFSVLGFLFAFLAILFVVRFFRKSQPDISVPIDIDSGEFKTYQTQKLGTFVLIYSKKNKNTWINNDPNIPLTVEGTEDKPNEEHLAFLENFNGEVQKLSDKITQKFKYEFKEAGLDASFSTWEDRFKIGSASVMLYFNNEAYWSITFEDQQEPFAHFTLFIEGQKLIDFAIDT